MILSGLFTDPSNVLDKLVCADTHIPTSGTLSDTHGNVLCRRRRIFYLCSAFNPFKCTHTWSSGHTHTWSSGQPGSSLRFGALLKGLTSVVDNSCRSRDSNPQPRVTSPTLYPLDHDCPLKLCYLFALFKMQLIYTSTNR